MIGYAYIYITYKGPFFNLAKGPEKHRAGPAHCRPLLDTVMKKPFTSRITAPVPPVPLSLSNTSVTIKEKEITHPRKKETPS